MHDVPETLARLDGVGGELVVRRRASGHESIYELIINGVFLMDTAETSTERLLADVLLKRHDWPERVLVGGLGFGCTVSELLADRRVERIDVVEIEPALVRMMLDGIVPGAEAVVAHDRVRMVVDDLRSVLPRCARGTYDGILLDVDNGPDFLVRAANAEVYQLTLLGSAARALRPGGLLTVWSSAPSAQLSSDLTDAVGHVEELVCTVERQDRQVDYAVYIAHSPAVDGS